jgi:hypothetical protein
VGEQNISSVLKVPRHEEFRLLGHEISPYLTGDTLRPVTDSSRLMPCKI